jgi:translation elongation factor EF-Tu-like GTPase
MPGEAGPLGEDVHFKLMEACDSFIPDPGARRQAVLMSIEDVFSIEGRGTGADGDA